MARINSIHLKDVTRVLAQFTAAGLAAVVLLHAAPQVSAQASQRTFAAPTEAIQAVIDAAERNDSAALLQLFGPNGKDILESGDPVQDKDARTEFARSAREKLEIEQDPMNPDRVTFAVGQQNGGSIRSPEGWRSWPAGWAETS
jgi:hypothetical protein